MSRKSPHIVKLSTGSPQTNPLSNRATALEKDSSIPPTENLAINVRERKRRSNSRKLALVYLSFYTPNFLIPISSRYDSRRFVWRNRQRIKQQKIKPKQSKYRVQSCSSVSLSFNSLCAQFKFGTLCHLK